MLAIHGCRLSRSGAMPRWPMNCSMFSRFTACAIEDDLSNKREPGTAFMACAHKASVRSVTLATLLNEPSVM